MTLKPKLIMQLLEMEIAGFEKNVKFKFKNLFVFGETDDAAEPLDYCAVL